MNLVNGLKFINVRWITGRDCIGIVLCEDTTTSKELSYIGVGLGKNLDEDILHIMSYGTKFNVGIAKQLIYGFKNNG